MSFCLIFKFLVLKCLEEQQQISKNLYKKIRGGRGDLISKNPVFLYFFNFQKNAFKATESKHDLLFPQYVVKYIIALLKCI